VTTTLEDFDYLVEYTVPTGFEVVREDTALWKLTSNGQWLSSIRYLNELRDMLQVVADISGVVTQVRQSRPSIVYTVKSLGLSYDFLPAIAYQNGHFVPASGKSGNWVWVANIADKERCQVIGANFAEFRPTVRFLKRLRDYLDLDISSFALQVITMECAETHWVCGEIVSNVDRAFWMIIQKMKARVVQHPANGSNLLGDTPVSDQDHIAETFTKIRKNYSIIVNTRYETRGAFLKDLTNKDEDVS